MRCIVRILALLTFVLPTGANASNARYVTAETLNVLLCPAVSCPATNRLYRQQQVEVFEIKNGWARISRNYDGAVENLPGRIVARWVPAEYLSVRRPSDVAQPALAAELEDPRIEYMPKVGDDGLTEADVTLLRRYAVGLLKSGACAAIDGADKSLNRHGVYYVHCKGELRNRFFTAKDVERLSRAVD